MLHRILAGAALSAGVVFAASSAQAVTLSNTDFEGFAAGSVDGQFDWSATGPYDQEVVDSGDSHGKVLRLSNAVTSGSFGDQVFAPKPGGVPNSMIDPVNGAGQFFAGESSTGADFNRFSFTFDFRSATDGAQNGLFLSISADQGQGGRQTYLGIADTGAGLDLSTYDVAADGSFIGAIPVAEVGYGAWHNIEFVVDYKDGPSNDVVSIYLDGVLKHTGTSWEDFYRVYQPVQHPLGVPSQTVLFRAGGTAAPGLEGGGLYFDNVLVTAELVPEPAALGLLGLGLVGLMAARRRKA